MKTFLDCYPCFVRQALEAARMAGAGEQEQRRLLGLVMGELREIPLDMTPPEIAGRIHRLVRQELGEGDPYREAKQTSTQQALALYPRLRALVDASGEPFDRAVRLAIAGNIIDRGLDLDYELWETVERVLAQPFAVDDGAALRAALSGAQEVLYLADNAGETVFDRVLIEALDVPVRYAVKGGPILNDATLEDAVAAGVDRVAALVSTGSNAPGTILSDCSAAFRRVFDQAELIIAKGQANYETLSEAGPRLFFLLQAKCPVIARDVGAGVPVGSIVLKRG